MITDLKYNSIRISKEIIAVLLTLPIFFVLSTVGLDYYYANLNESSFYFSESIMFSSFWLLFFPLLYFQYRLAQHSDNLFFLFSVLILNILLHTIIYPALIWLLSKLFYYHTYSYWQTFNYGITEYFLTTLIIYGLSFVFFYLKKSKAILRTSKALKEDETKDFLNSIIVTDQSNRKSFIKAEEILYFSAASPYVKIHHKEKKYLSTQTLKFLENNLDSTQFVRIHKSYIVNTKMVRSYKSRLNGDYDLTLTDNTVLRISRNYASDFKLKFEATHRLDQK